MTSMITRHSLVCMHVGQFQLLCLSNNFSAGLRRLSLCLLSIFECVGQIINLGGTLADLGLPKKQSKMLSATRLMQTLRNCNEAVMLKLIDISYDCSQPFGLPSFISLEMLSYFASFYPVCMTSS